MQTNLPRICGVLQSGSAQDSFTVCLPHKRPFFTAGVVQPARRYSPNEPCFEHNPRATALVEQPSTEQGVPPCFLQSPLKLAMFGQPPTTQNFSSPLLSLIQQPHPPCRQSAHEALLRRTASPATALLPGHQSSSLPLAIATFAASVGNTRRPSSGCCAGPHFRPRAGVRGSGGLALIANKRRLL